MTAESSKVYNSLCLCRDNCLAGSGLYYITCRGGVFLQAAATCIKSCKVHAPYTGLLLSGGYRTVMLQYEIGFSFHVFGMEKFFKNGC